MCKLAVFPPLLSRKISTVYGGWGWWKQMTGALQHHAGKFWCIIIFTRSCKLLPFEHDLPVVQKVYKGQHQTCLRFWYGEYLCKITKRYWQFLQSYRIHKAVWPWASLKVQKGHTKINIKLIQDFDVENTTIKLQLDTGNLWRVITFTRSSQMLSAWKFKNVTQRSRSNLVEILMNRTSLSVQLQHDADKFWCIIIFTRSCKMLPFEHDLAVVQKVKKVYKSQHRICPRFWYGKYLSKITKRYWQFLQSYCIHKAAWPWASLKVQKGHTKVNVKLIRDFYVENNHIKLQHDTGNLWRVIVFTRFRTLQPTHPSNDNTPPG